MKAIKLLTNVSTSAFHHLPASDHIKIELLRNKNPNLEKINPAKKLIRMPITLLHHPLLHSF
jgi:hypothetical protein